MTLTESDWKDRRIYLFGIEECGREMRVDFRTPHEEISAMDLILIAMKALNAVAKLVPGAAPKVAEVLKIMELDEVYDPDTLN